MVADDSKGSCSIALGGRERPEKPLWEPSMNTVCGVCHGGGLRGVLTKNAASLPPLPSLKLL